VVLVVGAIGAFVACTVGGLVGFASSLLLLPVLLLLDVPLWEAVSLNLALAVLTRLPSVIALRAHVDVRRTATMLAGTAPGIGIGLLLAAAVPSVGLELIAGAAVLLSGLYLLRARASAGDHRAPRGAATVLAGACSGALGVTTSLNGVPPAVLLARSGATVQTRLADLSVFFVLGNCVTIAAIALTRGLPMMDGSSTIVVWLVAGMLGNVVGLRLAASVGEGLFDAMTIWLVLLSGTGSLAGTAWDVLQAAG